MLYVEPDFYREFRCVAGECRHSCCKGWEIDIDPDTAELYMQLPGELGEELRKEVCQEPEPHFNLTDDEPCPFLNGQGLCRLILGFGEDVLCDICREHPRFYNEFSERLEMGLGLCCEEATRLLLTGQEPLKLIYEQEQDTEEQEPEILAIRRSVLDILADTGKSMEQRMDECYRLLGTKALDFDTAYWRDMFLSLERMDEEWTLALNSVKAEPENIPGDMAHTRLLQYIIYRNMVDEEQDSTLQLKFCFMSFLIICAMEQSGGELHELVRLWSAETEYSDENIAILTARL
jgi:lysine-N-methylase